MNYKFMMSFIICWLFPFFPLPLAAGAYPGEYILKDGKLCRVDNRYEPVATEGEILAVTRDGDVINYIKEIDGAWYAGRFSIPAGDVKEFLLGNNFLKLHRLSSCGNVFFFLADKQVQVNENSPRIEKILTRFDPESNEQESLKGVHDFVLMGNEPVLLDSSGVNCNGVIIPVMIMGETSVDKFIGGRLLFITNGNEAEVIDLLAQKNIYQYRDGTAYPYNSEYNIIIEFSDSVIEAESGNPGEGMIYYQMTLNGVDAGRTETGPGGVSKSSVLKAEPGKYSVIKAERWELDRDKGRYVRVNNVKQPEEFRVYIPDNRIIKIRVDFNGTEYSVYRSVYVN